MMHLDRPSQLNNIGPTSSWFEIKLGLGKESSCGVFCYISFILKSFLPVSQVVFGPVKLIESYQENSHTI
jgi:hypothetical protein